MTSHEKHCALIAQANAKLWHDVARADVEAGWTAEALFAQDTAAMWAEMALSHVAGDAQ